MATLASQLVDGTYEPETPDAAGGSPMPPQHPNASKRGFRGRGPRKGVLPKHLVRRATFAVISLSIFSASAMCLMAVWDQMARDVPWRAFASLGIIAGTMVAFAVVNEVCGEPSEPLGA
ncbi:MAG: hypothetical protein AAGH92_03300 [Planctomycetota bacterium]